MIDKQSISLYLYEGFSVILSQDYLKRYPEKIQKYLRLTKTNSMYKHVENQYKMKL